MTRWNTWNGCSKQKTTNVNLATGRKKEPKKATLTVQSSCDAKVEVVSLNITGGHHTFDTRVAKMTWNFLNKFQRHGALSRLQVQCLATDFNKDGQVDIEDLLKLLSDYGKKKKC